MRNAPQTVAVETLQHEQSSDVLDTPTFVRQGVRTIPQPDDPNAPDPLLDNVLPAHAIPKIALQIPFTPEAITLAQSANTPVAPAAPVAVLAAAPQQEYTGYQIPVAVPPATTVHPTVTHDGITHPVEAIVGMDGYTPQPATHAPTAEQTANALETAQEAVYPTTTHTPHPNPVPAFIDTADKVGADGKKYITIGLAPDLVAKLDELARITRTDRADVYRKGIAVLDLVLKGRKRQLRLGLVDNNGMLQNPIDGLER